MTTSSTPAEKAWYVPENAIWDDPYWRLPVAQEDAEQ
jgi:hypothetical protein